ncbi:transglutaminase-like domain-containing protein [Vibrio campbellii]|uniref:transglutaminase-like domain-containing protein n=1 Tax=Vibrio campbellii TaxID=680 RepID=UPI003AAAF721
MLWRDGVDSIAIGSLGTWQSVADKANFTMRKAFDDTTGLDALYLQLTKGATSTSEKIERILSFVSRDIRYVSRSEYGHAMTPHDIAETIENRFGDCKDKSVLLVGLFEKIGLSPELVLVSTKRTDPSRVLVPSMNAFNHVVVCFDYGGEHYCVDPTDTQTNWKYTSSWIQNKVALPLSKSASLGTIQKSPYRWKMTAETEILFDELGGQKEVQERTYTGEFAAVLRSNLYELSEKERLEKLTDQYADVVSSIGKPEFELENLDSMTSKAVIRSKSVIDPFLVVGEGLNYEEVDAWIENELDELKMSNEIYPALFQGVDIVSKFHYDTNGLWKITHVPATLELRHPLGVLKRQVKLISPTELSVTTELQVKSRWVKADETKRFNKMLDVFAEQSLIKFYGKAL